MVVSGRVAVGGVRGSVQLAVVERVVGLVCLLLLAEWWWSWWAPRGHATQQHRTPPSKLRAG
jgi:hypothetical protein